MDLFRYVPIGAIFRKYETDIQIGNVFYKYLFFKYSP